MLLDSKLKSLRFYILAATREGDLISPEGTSTDPMGERLYPREFDIGGVLVYAIFLVVVLAYSVYHLFLKKWFRRWRHGDPLFKGAVRWAAAAGDVKSLDALYPSPKFDVDSALEGFTALHAAVIGGHRDTVLWLCQRGADVKATKTDGWGDTALHYVAARGDVQIARVLLAYGADPRAKNGFGATPAEQARKHRHTELADYLANCATGKVQLPLPQELDNWKTVESSLPKSPSQRSSYNSTDSAKDIEIGRVAKPSTKLTPEQEAACRAAAARSHDGIGSEGTMVRPNTYIFRFLSFGMMAGSMIYLFWRGARSLVPYPIGNYIYCIFVYVVELSFLPLTFVFVMSMWNTIDRSARWAGDMLPKHKLPHVDVFIVRYSETIDVLEPTVIAALNMNWPGDKLTVHVLDDGSGKDVLKMVRRLRYQLTCMKREARLVYVARRRLRKVPHHSKAGNINHAILGSQGKGEYITVLDTDMIVHPDFLQRTIGHFYKRGPGGQGWVQKPRSAFLQTPQDFWNVPPSDPMVHCARFFYGPMLQGRDGIGAAPCCGTGVVFSRTALVSIGGQSYGSITEDYKTSVTLFSSGFSSMFLNERLAYGMAPEDLVEVFQQRRRWAMGALQILFQENPLCKPGLTIAQSLLFFEAAAYHYLAISTIILTIVPFLFVFLELAPIVAFKFWEFAAAFGTFFVLNRLAVYTVSRGIKGADNELWRGWQMWIWMSPNHVRSIFTVLISETPLLRWLTRKKKIKFQVTKKFSTINDRPHAAETTSPRKENLKAFLRTLSVTWYFLLYYLVFVAGIIYAIVIVIVNVQWWIFAMNIASLGWALLNCLCIWPPVSTLLPREETAHGWRIQWQALFSLGKASSGSPTHFGRTSLALSGSQNPSQHGAPKPESAAFEAVDPVASSQMRAGSIYNPGAVNAGSNPYGVEGLVPALSGQLSMPSVSRQRSANIGRVAGPLRTAASMQASALFTATILPEREGHTIQASMQPSMLAVAPSGELGPAPAGALPVFSVQSAYPVSVSEVTHRTVEILPSMSTQPQAVENAFHALHAQQEVVKQAEMFPGHYTAHAERQQTNWTDARTDDVLAGAAAKLKIVENEDDFEDYIPPPVPPTRSMAMEQRSHRAPNLDRAAPSDLAALVALTGDPAGWAQIMSTGETYHGADAGVLLEDIGVIDHAGHNPAFSRLHRGPTDMQSPFMGGLYTQSNSPAADKESSIYLREGSLRVDSLTDDVNLREELAAEAEFVNRFAGRRRSNGTWESSISEDGSISIKITQLRPFAAAAQEDCREVSVALPRGSMGLEFELFKPFAAGAQDDCQPWMVIEEGVPAQEPGIVYRLSGRNSPSSYGNGARRPQRMSLDGPSPFLTGAMLPAYGPTGPVPVVNGQDSSAYLFSDRLESTFDASLILPEPVRAGSTFYTPFATAAMTHWDEQTTSRVRFGPETTERFSRHNLQTAPSAAQDRARLVSHQLLDILSSMTPNASAALRSSSVLVVPVMPASVFEHSIGSKPCFEASPPSPSNIAYVLVSVLMVLALIASSITENYLTIE